MRTKIISFFFVLSIMLNLIFIVVVWSTKTKNLQITQIFNELQKEVEQEKNLDKNRMNGTVILQKEENLSFDQVVDFFPLKVDELKNLKFNKNSYNFEANFDRVDTITKDGIFISVQKIKRDSPYLVLYEPSEWLGVMDIESMVSPIITSSTFIQPYNFEINGFHFARNFGFFKPSGGIKLTYKTVQESKSNYDYLLYYQFGIWENILNLDGINYTNAKNNPEEWFKIHPSSQFQKLDSFIQNQFSKPQR